MYVKFLCAYLRLPVCVHLCVGVLSFFVHSCAYLCVCTCVWVC